MTSPFVRGRSRHSGYEFCELTGKVLPGVIVLVLVVVYLLPNALESVLIRCGAPPVALVIIDDLAGCAVLSVALNTRWALGIYLIASTIEFALLRYGGIGPRTLMWTTDLFPTAILVALVVYAASRGLNWRNITASGSLRPEIDR
jgi:hypothetical protein